MPTVGIGVGFKGGRTNYETGAGRRWGVEGLRYHTGIPKVRLGRLKVAITGVAATPSGGNKKGI